MKFIRSAMSIRYLSRISCRICWTRKKVLRASFLCGLSVMSVAREWRLSGSIDETPSMKSKSGCTIKRLVATESVDRSLLISTSRRFRMNVWPSLKTIYSDFSSKMNSSSFVSDQSIDTFFSWGAGLWRSWPTRLIDSIALTKTRLALRLTVFYGYERSAHAASFC